jgi:flagellar hook protein FlgE
VPLTFNTSGQLTAAMPLQMTIDLNAAALANGTTNNAAQYILSNLDYTGSSQFGSPFGVTSATQDGYAAGELAGFNIGQDGVLQGRYTNGQTRTLGQLALANFANPQGLQPLGDNQWSESPNSGAALLGQPGAAGLGMLQSSATEDSNVDLTQELVNMIVAQRAYQANAQTIKTQDAIQQTLMNLR